MCSLSGLYSDSDCQVFIINDWFRQDALTCFTDCSPEIEFADYYGNSVESEASLAVGDVITCSAEGAVSYRWTNVDNSGDAAIYGKTLSITLPGGFNYECRIFMECGTGVICPLTRNISGFARGIKGKLVVFYLAR